MQGFRNLNRLQQVLLILLLAMALIYAPVYSVVISRVGFKYEDSILIPAGDSGNTTYTGTIDGEEAVFTVTSDSVTLRYGSKIYGPYTVREDVSAIPKDHVAADYMTGVEILDGEEIFFRGGVYGSGNDLTLYDEDGSLSGFTSYAVASDGTILGGNGTIVDPMEPSAKTILRLLDGPELTHKGDWRGWLTGVLISALTAVTILFADELFYLNLAFRIRDAEYAEPSEWELTSRNIGWVIMTIMVLVIYTAGLG